MNLVMLDIDGTLTLSYDYDEQIFGQAIGELLERPPVNADLNGYVDKTSTGVTQEAIRRITGRMPTAEQLEKVKADVQRRLERMYQASPESFAEVPGAATFLEQLRSLKSTKLAIATGCWQSEALFKLRSSELDVTGIPMATSDDDRNRTRIMQMAVEKARDFYSCNGFERIVYIGDGPWDYEEARSLGYGFIGIGPRVQGLKDTQIEHWHPDFMDLEAVLASVVAALRL